MQENFNIYANLNLGGFYLQIAKIFRADLSVYRAISVYVVVGSTFVCYICMQANICINNGKSIIIDNLI